MPYSRIDQLPDSANNLPTRAQELYKEAFNIAEDEYHVPAERRVNGSHEETAHRVAWSAVKKKYEKRGDRWVRKDKLRPNK